MTIVWAPSQPIYPVPVYRTALGGGRFDVWTDEVSPPMWLATESPAPNGVGLLITIREEES